MVAKRRLSLSLKIAEAVLNQDWSSPKVLPAGPRGNAAPGNCTELGMSRPWEAHPTPPGHPGARGPLTGQRSPRWTCPEARAGTRGSLGCGRDRMTLTFPSLSFSICAEAPRCSHLTGAPRAVA